MNILGSGGHARVVAAAAVAAGLKVDGFWDDDPVKVGGDIDGIPILGLTADLPAGSPAIIAIGSNRVREKLASLPLNWVSVIHPHAWIAPTASVGEGSMVIAGAVIQPGAVIGQHSIVNTSASVDHDCKVGNFVHLAPGSHLAGSVHIEDGAFVGIGATVIPSVQIGSWSVVGAGACVIRDVESRSTVVGVPAKVRVS